MPQNSSLENSTQIPSQQLRIKAEHRAGCDGIDAPLFTGVDSATDPVPAPPTIPPRRSTFYQYGGACNGAAALIRAAEAVPASAGLDPSSSIKPEQRGRKGSL
jgi:hypothetical protein